MPKRCPVNAQQLAGARLVAAGVLKDAREQESFRRGNDVFVQAAVGARQQRVDERRQVAFILATLTAEESARLPWFRVVAANGVVSSVKRGAVGRKQIERLRAEGVAVTPRNKVEGFHVIAWLPG